MTTIALPQLAGSNLLTHSRMSTRKACARKHYIAYELGVRPDYGARPLRMGAAIHIGIDQRAQGASENAAIWNAVASYQEMPAWANTDELQREWINEGETVARLLKGYFARWGCCDGQPLGVGVASVVASEMAFDLPIRNPDTGGCSTVFRLAGKIDKIVILEDGRLAVMEHKTCSEDLGPESDYWRRLRIDQQISTYILAARQLGYDVETVLYDVIRKPEISPRQIPVLDGDGVKIVLDAQGNRVRTKDGKKWRESGDAAAGYTLQQRREEPHEFGERLTADIESRPEFYFARKEIPRLESDLAEFEAELWQIQQEIRESQKHGRHFRNTNQCLVFGKCPYFGPCTDGVDLAEHLPAGFVRVADIHPELKEAE